MIAPISAGVNALYTGVARGAGEVRPVAPVERRAAGEAETSNGSAPQAAEAARPASEAGKGLLLDLYA